MAFAYSDRGYALTESSEGVRLTAYQDSVGVWTIGYGHTLGVKAGDVCTAAQADHWLHEDIAAVVACVNSLVTSRINQNQFDALVDFAFNLGCGALSRSTLLRHVNAERFVAARLEFSKWIYAGGEVLAGLVKRRAAEAALFAA